MGKNNYTTTQKEGSFQLHRESSVLVDGEEWKFIIIPNNVEHGSHFIATIAANKEPFFQNLVWNPRNLQADRYFHFVEMANGLYLGITIPS